MWRQLVTRANSILLQGLAIVLSEGVGLPLAALRLPTLTRAMIVVELARAGFYRLTHRLKVLRDMQKSGYANSEQVKVQQQVG